MRRDQLRYRCFQARCIDWATIEFDVEVRGDTAQLLFVGATDPIRMLHGGERERRCFQGLVWLGGPIVGCCRA